MPVQLVEFHFEDWRDPAWDADYEPGGHFQHYLARTEWVEGRRRWLNGEDWQLMIQSPRPVQGDSVYTSSIPETAPEGAYPQARATDWKGP